jgi:L-ascorbate metabolism protein UlaG (beta-lactamase superfamily)
MRSFTLTAGQSLNPSDVGGVLFRWLGAAGIELSYGEESLLIDPFFSRPPFWRLWFGRVVSAPATFPASLPRCEHILVTHAHYDHLMDVPAIARRTLAKVYGSTNACELLSVCGLPDEQICEIHPGDQLRLGTFQVEAIEARHGKAPGFSPGQVRKGLEPPLRLRDYVMDEYDSFLVQLPRLRLLDWCGVETQGAPAADVLFMLPSSLPGYTESLIAAVQPRLVVPVHWDDLFHSLSQPMRPTFELPRWELPPLRRVDLMRTREAVQQVKPDAEVRIPEVFRLYDLSKPM